jgi:hypothetical protein
VACSCDAQWWGLIDGGVRYRLTDWLDATGKTGANRAEMNSDDSHKPRSSRSVWVRLWGRFDHLLWIDLREKNRAFSNRCPSLKSVCIVGWIGGRQARARKRPKVMKFV